MSSAKGPHGVFENCYWFDGGGKPHYKMRPRLPKTPTDKQVYHHLTVLEDKAREEWEANGRSRVTAEYPQLILEAEDILKTSVQLYCSAEPGRNKGEADDERLSNVMTGYGKHWVTSCLKRFGTKYDIRGKQDG